MKKPTSFAGNSKTVRRFQKTSVSASRNIRAARNVVTVHIRQATPEPAGVLPAGGNRGKLVKNLA
jgi:hypothetical protein